MLIRLSYLFIVLTLAIVAFLFVRFSQPSAADSARFVGVDRCRVCHESTRSGAQFEIWSKGPHGFAYQALLSDSAQRYIAEHKVSMDSCLTCHTTLGRPAFNDREKEFNAEGVGCERCHGAGSRYALYHIMVDRAAFRANGGVVGSTDDCYQCHAANPSTESRHCPFQLASFDADSAWSRIRHSVPDTTNKPDTVLDLR